MLSLSKHEAVLTQAQTKTRPGSRQTALLISNPKAYFNPALKFASRRVHAFSACVLS